MPHKMSLFDVAAELGVSATRVRSLIRRGLLHANGDGTFDPREVQALHPLVSGDRAGWNISRLTSHVLEAHMRGVYCEKVLNTLLGVVLPGRRLMSLDRDALLERAHRAIYLVDHPESLEPSQFTDWSSVFFGIFPEYIQRLEDLTGDPDIGLKLMRVAEMIAERDEFQSDIEEQLFRQGRRNLTGAVYIRLRQQRGVAVAEQLVLDPDRVELDQVLARARGQQRSAAGSRGR